MGLCMRVATVHSLCKLYMLRTTTKFGQGVDRMCFFAKAEGWFRTPLLSRSTRSAVLAKHCEESRLVWCGSQTNWQWWCSLSSDSRENSEVCYTQGWALSRMLKNFFKEWSMCGIRHNCSNAEEARPINWYLLTVPVLKWFLLQSLQFGIANYFY